MASVLLVEACPRARHAQRVALESEGFHVAEAASGAAALEALRCAPHAVVITPLEPPGGGRGVLEAALELDPDLPVLVFTPAGDERAAAGAMRAGAWQAVAAPADPEVLALLARRAAERRALAMANAVLRRACASHLEFPRILGASPALLETIREVRAAAANDAPVLVHGETGTGKGLIARALHHLGPRREGPFVVVRPAWEPAVAPRLLALADGGTLYLDGVGHLDREAQARCERWLDDRAILAGRIRVVASALDDLRDAVASGAFPAALHFRLAAVRVRVPPLRERPEDIAVLAERCLERLGRDTGFGAGGFTADALAALATEAWPGNVRELEACVERAAFRAGRRRIDLGHLGLHPEPENRAVARAIVRR